MRLDGQAYLDGVPRPGRQFRIEHLLHLVGYWLLATGYRLSAPGTWFALATGPPVFRWP
jgi:hypothetical protein